jgi:uncharacterized DUF497 family protein
VRRFRWNDWNVDHIANHGVSPGEAEYLVNHARSPYPRRIRDEKFYVAGQAPDGSYLQVIFVLDPDETVFVIHARPLTERERAIYRRSIR